MLFRSKPSFQNRIYEEFPLFSPLNFPQYQSQRKGKVPFKQFPEKKENPKKTLRKPLSRRTFFLNSLFFSKPFQKNGKPLETYLPKIPRLLSLSIVFLENQNRKKKIPLTDTVTAFIAPLAHLPALMNGQDLSSKDSSARFLESPIDSHFLTNKKCAFVCVCE